jgi:hypothetical protein
MAEEERRNNVDYQPNESEDVGRDASERQSIHDAVKQPSAGAAKSSCPGHSSL